MQAGLVRKVALCLLVWFLINPLKFSVRQSFAYWFYKHSDLLRVAMCGCSRVAMFSCPASGYVQLFASGYVQLSTSGYAQLFAKWLCAVIREWLCAAVRAEATCWGPRSVSPGPNGSGERLLPSRLPWSQRD
jgi:hypothetical protein